MKQIDHFTGTAGKQQSLKAVVALLLMGVMLTLLPAALQAQSIKNFTQRTSNYSPDMPIYHIKGDYTMIGNTNLSNINNLSSNNYTDDNNSNTRMYYVDVDGNTFPTINSSTAALTFSDEFGANPACSEVLYAGLYWTGITDDTRMDRTITGAVYSTSTPTTLYSGGEIGDYRLTITLNGDNRIFTFTNGSNTVVLTMSRNTTSNNRYKYTVDNNGYARTTTRNQYHLAEFITTDRQGNITEDISIPLNDNYNITGLYWNSTWDNCYATVREVVTPAYIISKNKIKIRHANASEYTEVEATPENIYYDYQATSSYQSVYIYTAYTEVTDYVRQYGLGNYTVADLLTKDGIGGSLGYFGCWGMVVVYENSKMKWRDITIFDGFANVSGSNPQQYISIEGFKTVQVGDVNVKLGMMAAEGDRGITGDGCAIEKHAGGYETLGHPNQTSNTDNFFNSSIETGGNYRYPNYVNNTGIDILMIELQDPEIFTNEQTETSFRFTTVSDDEEADGRDQYHPFCFVMGVDAYIPEAEALSGVMDIDEDDITIDSETGNYLIKPGKEITFAVEVKNFGTEDIVDAKLEIPLPSTIEYYYTEVEYVHPGINIEGYFDAERYANGVAGWNIDYIPSGDPNQVYARVLLTVKVTNDCYVLASTDPECELAIEVNGTLEGTSYVNRVDFKKESFISGFADETGCQGNAIRNDIKVVVDKVSYVNNNCQDQDYTERLVTVCRNDFSDSNPIPFMKIYALYPQGSRFFNAVTREEYTAATGFPISLAGNNASSAALIYVQPTSIYSAACTSELRFILDPDGDSFTTPTLTSSATYCLDAEEVNPLSSHIISEIPDDVYFRFYKANNNSAVAYVDIVPPTDVEGTYTYYVRQFRKNAIGCEDETFYGPITIEVVSPITFTSSEDSPSCIGEEVTITGMPAGGEWSFDPTQADQITFSGDVLTIAGDIAGTYTVTYTHTNPGTADYNCTNTVRSYTHQIAATTNPGTLEADQTICQGAQIQPLRIEGHIGHVERWEWTTNQNNENWDPIPNNTSSISTADLGELAVGTYYFKALVKDGNCNAEWTDAVTIEVTDDLAPNPPAVTSPQFACIGTEHTIQPSGGNYQWYEQAIGGWPIEDASGNPANSITVTITDEWISRYVSEVDDLTGCVSDRAEVQVRPNLEPGAIATTGQRECDLNQTPTTIGSNIDAVAYGEEGTVQYQWYVQVNGGEAQLIEGATDATFTPQAYMGREGEYIFIRKVKNSTCDNWQQSRGEWRLVVGKPDASIEAFPEHAIICQGAGVELRLSVRESAAYSYQWYRDGNAISGATDHEYIATVAGIYTARVTHRASDCSAITPEAGKIDVKYDNAPPTATSVTTELGGCSIEDAPEAYNDVIAANASRLGFDISDGITPEESLTLDHTEAETEDLPTGVCYQLVRTYTVTDQCGFYTTFTHTINVEDREAPSIGTIVVPAAVPAGSCKYKIPDLSAATLAVSSDNCSDVSFVEQTPAAGFEYSQTNTEQTVTVVVKVKDACNNKTIKEVQITIPAIPTISAAGSALDCYGDSDGNISYTITGGHANYTVVLSLAGTDLQTATHTTAGDYSMSGLASGIYTVTVTDANGCTATASATVSEPSALSVSLTKVDETCAGDDGKINYTIAGGTAGYTVVLSGGSANQTANQTATGTYTFTGLKAGTYTVTVADGNTCEATATATVTLSNNFTVTPSNTAVCSGANFTINPEASHTAKYSWAEPTATGITGAEAGTNASNISGTLTNTTTSATNITYTVTATTTNGLCTALPFEVEVTVYAPVMGGSIQKDFISCNVADTIVKLTNVTAGNGGYGGTYGWEKSTDNGTTWTSIPNSNGVDYTPSYHDNLGTVLYRRMYDANCDEKPSNTVSVTYYGNILAGDVICNNGCAANYCSGSSVSVTLSTSNITVQSGASYSIQWQQSIDNGATWTDISGDTSNTYTYTNSNFTSPIQFRYTITVTGCAAVPSNSVHKIGVWALPVVSITDVTTLCPSAASTDITGTIKTPTTPNYTYYWSPGSGLTLPNLPDPNLPESATSVTSNTIRGTFPTADCNASYSASLYVIDGHGCQSNTATEKFTVVDTVAPVISSGYATTVEATVNNCAYTYPDLRDSIRGYSTDNCTARGALVITQSPAQGDSITQTTGAQTLPVTVTVKDACNKETTTTIYVTVPAQLKLAETHTDETCNESNDGTIDLTVTGGKENYTYSWQKDGSSYSPATQDLSGLEAATYTVTVADAHGCTATISAIINQPDSLKITSLSSASNCYNQADGYINYTFSGGTPNYTVSIGTADTNAHVTAASGTFNGLADSTYTVTVKDGNECTTTATTTIKQISDTLTITAQSNTWEYNDQPHTQPYYNVTFGSEQYSIASDSSATLANGDVVTATVSGSITNAGTAANTVTNVTVTRGGTDVTCYYNIDEVDGTLTITPINVVVTITGHTDTKDYDGEEHTVTGYDVEISKPELYTVADFTFNGDSTVSETNVGTYPMNLTAEDFTNTNANFDTVTFVIVDGALTIEPRPVTLTSATDSKIYDGTPLTNSTVTVSGDGFVDGEGATYDVTGTITNVGSCYNTFTYTLNSNTDANNYTITKIEGTLTILIDSVPPCIGCDPIAGVSCETIGNQTRTNDENRNYYTHSGTAWDVNATDNSGAIPVMTWSLTGVTTASGSSTLDGQRFNVGVTTVTWTATDVTGNPATCQFTVTVTDDEDPVIICPSDIAGIACITDVPAAYADYAAFQTAGGVLKDNDVVDYESFALFDADTNGTCPTTITRTYYIEDTTGNRATCEQVITIKDSIAPALKVADSWPDNITGQDNCFANRNISGLMSNDAVKALYSDCNTFTVSHEDTVTGNNCGWTVTRTYTITDLCENTVMPKPTMSVSGSDQTEPYIMPTVLDRTLTATGCEFIIPDMREEVRAISSDGCTGNSALTVEQPSAGMQVYPQVIARDTNVIIRVTDSCGNYSLKSVKITIPAKVVITATATPASICNGETAQLSTTVANVVGAASYVWEPTTGLNSTTIYNPTTTLTATDAPETVTYTVKVTDANGCTATATTFVTVNPEVVIYALADTVINSGTAVPAKFFTTPLTGGVMTYSWTRTNADVVTGMDATGTGNVPGATLYNNTNTAKTTTITVTPTFTANGISCVGATVSYTITVNPTIVMDTVANQAICHGSEIEPVIFGTTITDATSFVYNWVRTNTANVTGLTETGSGNIDATALYNETDQVQVTTFTVTPTYTNNDISSTGTPITFTITVYPKVVMNDVDDQAICHNSAIEAVNFSSDLSGGDITYTWRRTNSNIGGLDMSDTGNIPATVLTNTTNTVQVDTITVTPVYTNNGNECTDETITFTITVNPKVGMETPDNQSICHGSAITAVTFSSDLSGGDITYTWRRTNSNIDGLDMSGTGNIPTTVLTNTTNRVQVDTIYVKPTYEANSNVCDDDSVFFTITVNPKVVMDTVADQAICHGSAIAAVTFSSDLTGGDITYTWRRTNSNVVGLDMSGTGNIPTTVLTNTTNRVQVDTIYVKPTYEANSNVCDDDSVFFTITVNPEVGMETPDNQSICHGSAITAVNFSSDLTGGDITYTWRRTNSNIDGLDMSGTGNIPTTVLTNTTNTAQVDTIYVKPTYEANSNVCDDDSVFFTITVNPEVRMDTPDNQAICHGTDINSVVFTTPITDGTVVYNWTRTNDNIGGLAMSGTGNIAAVTLTNTTNTAQTTTITVTPVYTNNGKTCTDETITFTITVYPKVVMDTVADQAICHNSAIEAVNFTTTITDGSVDYNWIRDNENIGGLAMSGTGNIAAATLTNTTNTAQTTTITVTPVYANNGKTCTDETITFTITVYPKVVMDTVADQAICHGSAITAVNFSSDLSGGDITYTWRRTNSNIGGLDMSDTGNIPATVLTNTTNTVQVDTITVTPVYTNNGNECTDETITFTITVNPKVVMNDVADQAICHGSAITAVNFTTPITDGSVVYNWTRDNNNIGGLAMSGTGNIPATVLTNTTNTAQVDTITVTPVYTNNGNECTDESITFTITVNPKVVMNDVVDQAICHGSEMAAVSFTTPITDGSVVYNWSRNNENIEGLEMSGTGNIAAATLTNTTNTAQTTTITVTPVYTNNGNECTDESITFTITVNPEVVMNTVEDWTLCVGETSPEYVYTSTITDGTVTYGWSNDNSAIGLAASGTGNLPSFVAANSTSANLIAEVKVAPTYANNGISCQGDSINFHITVRPSITTPGNVAFTCPADTTVVLSYSECEQFVNIGYPEFVNNMTGMTVNITNDAPEGNIFPEGTTIVTWTATDECGAFLTCTQSVVIQFPSCGDSIADFDGYRYSSVRIGCQCWTGENARSEHYSDGTPVDNFRYYNDSDSLENIYGKLYTWYTAVRVPEGDDTAVPADSIDPLGNSYVQGICPEGWALPTVDEYMLMIANSGDATHAKDGSNLYWLPGYEGQPPFSGFDAYGAGKYNGAIDRYQDLLGKTYFWTTLSGSGSETATTVEINYYCAEGLQTELSKGDGVSIRCIRKR